MITVPNRHPAKFINKFCADEYNFQEEWWCDEYSKKHRDAFLHENCSVYKKRRTEQFSHSHYDYVNKMMSVKMGEEERNNKA